MARHLAGGMRHDDAGSLLDTATVVSLAAMALGIFDGSNFGCGFGGSGFFGGVGTGLASACFGSSFFLLSSFPKDQASQLQYEK